MKHHRFPHTSRKALKGIAGFLSILMMLSVIMVSPISAEEASDYSYDLTALTSDTMDNADVFTYGSASTTAYTADGLQLIAGVGSPAGLLLNTPTTGNFVIDLDMSMHNFGNDVSNSFYLRYNFQFGYGYNATTNVWGNSNSYDNIYLSTDQKIQSNYFRHAIYSSSNEAYKMHYSFDADMDDVWNDMTGEKEFNFRIFVENGKIARVSIVGEKLSVTFMATTTEKACNVSDGTLAFYWRPYADYVQAPGLTEAPYVNVKSIQLSPNATKISAAPAVPALNYADNADVNYTVGTVLHNMDFSKVSSLAETGYSITDANPFFAGVVDDRLSLISSSNGFLNLVFTGNGMPKNIQRYTTAMRLHYATSAVGQNGVNKLILVHDTDLTSAGKLASTVATNLNQDGTISDTIKSQTTGASTLSETTVEAFRRGEWFTVICSYKDGYLEKIVLQFEFEVNGVLYSETMVPVSATGIAVSAGAYHGIRLRNTWCNIEITDIQMVAGTYDEQAASDNGLLWPEEDNALVQTVVSPVTAKYLQTKTNESGKLDVRFIGLVNFEELSAYAKVGYRVTIMQNGNEIVTDYDISDTAVYNSVLANGDEYSTEQLGGNYLYMLELRNFATDSSYEVTLTAFAEKENGARIYDYNGALDIQIVEGQIQA